MSSDNKWVRPESSPAPLFVGPKESDFVKHVNDELVERVVGQQILYYPIDVSRTNYHPIYGEAINKTFLPPIRVYVLIEWQGTETKQENFGIDQRTMLKLHFHKRRLNEDQNIEVRIGDFVLYGDEYFEIVDTDVPKQLFGQHQTKVEISANCKRSREGFFDAT